MAEQKHKFGRCRLCGRDYEPEAVDIGICCICSRDWAYHRVFGDDWQNIIKACNPTAAPDHHENALYLASRIPTVDSIRMMPSCYMVELSISVQAIRDIHAAIAKATASPIAEAEVAEAEA